MEQSERRKKGDRALVIAHDLYIRRNVCGVWQAPDDEGRVKVPPKVGVEDLGDPGDLGDPAEGRAAKGRVTRGAETLQESAKSVELRSSRSVDESVTLRGRCRQAKSGKIGNG